MISQLSTLEMRGFCAVFLEKCDFFIIIIIITHLLGPGSASLVKEIATEQIGIVGSQSHIFFLSGI